MDSPSAAAPTVLIVEDDPVLAGLVARLLERNGMLPEIARDGFEAIERLKTAAAFDAIALDLMMPRVDGFGVIDWLRTNAPERLTRVIVMTATTDTHLARLRPSELGGLIRKPFEIHELGRLIRTRTLGEDDDDTATKAVTSETLFDAL